MGFINLPSLSEIGTDWHVGMENSVNKIGTGAFVTAGLIFTGLSYVASNKCHERDRMLVVKNSGQNFTAPPTIDDTKADVNNDED